MVAIRALGTLEFCSGAGPCQGKWPVWFWTYYYIWDAGRQSLWKCPAGSWGHGPDGRSPELGDRTSGAALVRDRSGRGNGDGPGAEGRAFLAKLGVPLGRRQERRRSRGRDRCGAADGSQRIKEPQGGGVRKQCQLLQQDQGWWPQGSELLLALAIQAKYRITCNLVSEPGSSLSLHQVGSVIRGRIFKIFIHSY